MTIPSTQMRLTLARAGERWDAVRVSHVVGEQVTATLAAACGSVVSDGLHMWYFVEPGDGTELAMPGAKVLSSGDHVLIPADNVTTPPGPHWARVAYNRRNTNLHRLRAALTAVIG
jgi:hypothetical protein